jgi:hypothetical protein
MFKTNTCSIKEALAFPTMREDVKNRGCGGANAQGQMDKVSKIRKHLQVLKALMATLEAEIMGLVIKELS